MLKRHHSIKDFKKERKKNSKGKCVVFFPLKRAHARFNALPLIERSISILAPVCPSAAASPNPLRRRAAGAP